MSQGPLPLGAPVPRLLLLPAGSLMFPTLRLTPGPPTAVTGPHVPCWVPGGEGVGPRSYILLKVLVPIEVMIHSSSSHRQCTKAALISRRESVSTPARLLRAATHGETLSRNGPGLPGGREEEAAQGGFPSTDRGREGPPLSHPRGRCPKCITQWGGISPVGILKGWLWPLHPEFLFPVSIMASPS